MAKSRMFPSLEKTVEYAKMLKRAGTQILTCYSHTREQRGQNTVCRDLPPSLQHSNPQLRHTGTDTQSLAGWTKMRWTKMRAVKAVVSSARFRKQQHHRAMPR